MPKPTDGHQNERYGPNKAWDIFCLQRYFVSIAQSASTLRALYVSNCFDADEETVPFMNAAYSKMLRTRGIHRADGRPYIRADSASNDCEHIRDFIDRACLENDDYPRIRQRRSSDRLLIILAGIGEGKSTLLEYFFRVYAPDNIGDEIIRLGVDFDTFAISNPDTLTSDWISEKVLDQIHLTYPSIMGDKVELMKALEELLARHEGVLQLTEVMQGTEACNETRQTLVERYHSNTTAMTTSAINYLVRHKNKRVAVVLDNVDRLPANCQTRAVQMLREALHSWDCAGIVAVREYTYGRLWVMTEWGFETPLLYHKRPPRLTEVLRKRFKTAEFVEPLGNLRMELGDKPLIIKNPEHFVGNIMKFLWAPDMEQSLLSLCNGNVRQVLKMAESFLSYHALDLESLVTATYLHSREEAEALEHAILNYDHFLESVIVGNNKYYSSSQEYVSSVVAETYVLNVLAGTRQHPLMTLRLLTYLSKYKVANLKSILRIASEIGFDRDLIIDTLEIFFKTYMIESMQGHNISEVAEIVITRKGLYYHNILCTLTVYLAHVLNDTDWPENHDPYVTPSSPGKMSLFLVEGLGMLLEAEKAESKEVTSHGCIAAYKEFLDKRSFTYRAAASTKRRFEEMQKRGVGIPSEFFTRIESILHDALTSETNGEIVVSGDVRGRGVNPRKKE